MHRQNQLNMARQRHDLVLNFFSITAVLPEKLATGGAFVWLGIELSLAWLEETGYVVRW